MRTPIRLSCRCSVALILAVGCLVGVPAVGWGGEAPSAPEAAAEAGELFVDRDPDLVFTKAFWRRPGADDRVVEAERREWRDNAGRVVKWEWFLLIEPGPATREWFATNPFGLAAADAPRLEGDPPEWFPAHFPEHHVITSLDFSFLIATSRDGHRLYATDSGFGFTPPNPGTSESEDPKK